MCGLAGFIDIERRVADPERSLQQMISCLVTRGPDDEGVWFCPKSGVGLGHRRLSIIDLSPEGHQPMVSHSRRNVIVYNGEVYNFRAMRHELEGRGHRFRGTSDTEVILAAIDEWGIEQAVEKFIGMFSLAVWDNNEGVLHLVRDRLGIKPLYYGFANGSFVFASELKAIRAFPGFDCAIDRDSVALLLRYAYVPSPASIYEGIHKLPPGTIVSLRANNGRLGSPRERQYWSGSDVAEKGIANPLEVTSDEALERLDELIRDAVLMRMIADVPLGAFLSGGIDSSLVVAMMQAQSSIPVKTFTIGFREAEFNEAQFAKAVATHLGTEHTELYVEPDDALAVIPGLPSLYDEPFADSSQIPTYLVSRLARQKVTVSLSGDGGDELFYGYDRYPYAAALWRKIEWLTPFGRKFAGIALHNSGALLAAGSGLFSAARPRILPVADRLKRGALKLDVADANQFYRMVMSQWQNPELAVPGAHEPPIALIADNLPKLRDFGAQMMCIDLLNYLPDDILTKVDRASMGVSLEARVPLLDHRIVEFAWRLPATMRSKAREPKWLLKELLKKYVPAALIDRPKMGFGVPVGPWLCGPLRPWAEELLDDTSLRESGFFAPRVVRRLWASHLNGDVDHHYQLWPILMFQAWFQETRAERPAIVQSVARV